MAENVTLARPYAEAAFKLARDNKAPAMGLAAWKEALDRMALVAADPEMQRSMANPKLLPAQLAQLFIEVTGKLSGEQKNLVRVLVANERLVLLPEIHDLFIQLKNEYEGIKQVRITSAFPLDSAAVKKLIAELEPRFNCKLEANVDVDPELIGGVKIAVGDEVIDASVRGKLAVMSSTLKS